MYSFMTEIQAVLCSALRHQTWEMPELLLQSYVSWSKSVTSGMSIFFYFFFPSGKKNVRNLQQVYLLNVPCLQGVLGAGLPVMTHAMLFPHTFTLSLCVYGGNMPVLS